MNCTYCGKQHRHMNSDACRLLKTTLADLKARREGTASPSPTALSRVEGPPSLIDQIRRDRGADRQEPPTVINPSTGVVRPPSMIDALIDQHRREQEAQRKKFQR